MARVGRYLTGESGEMWGGGRDRGKRKGEGEEGRMGRLGQDKKWRGGAVLGGAFPLLEYQMVQREGQI